MTTEAAVANPGLASLEYGHHIIVAAVAEKILNANPNGGYRANVVLQDRSGTMPGVLFTEAEIFAEAVAVGDVISADGMVDQYRGRKQIKIENWRKLKSGEYDLAALLPSVENPEALFVTLRDQVIMQVVSPELRKFLGDLVGGNAAALKEAPAAIRNHHARVGGLLDHIVSMSALAWKVWRHYHPALSLDLLLAGVILHDIGKLQEIARVGATWEYTLQGNLVGHVAGAVALVDRCDYLPERTKLALQHMIVSHHGDLDKGALRRPMFPEAMVLHFLDHMDAMLDMSWRIIDELPSGEEITQFSGALDRRLWRV